MTVEVYLADDAIDDLRALDGAIVPRVLKQLLRIEKNIDVGRPLGAGHGGQALTGFRKISVADRQYRIIYRPMDDGTVAVVWVIGSRTQEECYEQAWERLQAHPNGPVSKRLADVLTLLGKVDGREVPAKRKPKRTGWRRQRR